MTRFSRIALAAAFALLPAAASAASLFNVIGVGAHDTLNLRATPDAKAAKTGALPPNATGVAVVAVDSKSLDWVKITKGKLSGWVNAKFLAYDSGLPARLICQGTEPFWFIGTGPGSMTADFSAMDGGKARISLGEPIAAASRPYPWLVRVNGKSPGFLVIDKRVCSDDMSESDFPYAVAASVSGHFVEGCCK